MKTNTVSIVGNILSRIIAHDKKSGIVVTPLLSYRIEETKLPGTFIGIDIPNEILYIDPQIFNELSDLEKRFALYHEAMHIVLAHDLRKGNRDHRMWNIASDFEINWILKKNEIHPPEYVLYSKEFENKYAEQIYEELKKHNIQIDENGNREGENQSGKKQKQRESHGGKGGGESGNPPGRSVSIDGKIIGRQIDFHREYHGSEIGKARMNSQKAIAQIEQIFKEAGSSSLVGLERIVSRIFSPRVDWRELLAQSISFSRGDDYSYRRPQRQRLALDSLYLPSLISSNPEVVVIVDVSGSIGERELRKFISEVVGVLSTFRTTVIFCDDEVRGVIENPSSIEDITENIIGGGGTRFEPAFKWIEDNCQGNVITILMTDGYNSDSEIPIPSMVERIIVLTTEKEPSGIESDVCIKVDPAEL